MTDDFFQCDTGEAFKGSIHLGLGALLVICAAYNAGAFCVRPSRRLAGHMALYFGAALYEARQVHQHWTARL